VDNRHAMISASMDRKRPHLRPILTWLRIREHDVKTAASSESTSPDEACWNRVIAAVDDDICSEKSLEVLLRGELFPDIRSGMPRSRRYDHRKKRSAVETMASRSSRIISNSSRSWNRLNILAAFSHNVTRMTAE